ncbi:hypothetical protein BH23CHL4_BH23CHL4_27510 [soil metagenome]
MLANLMVIPPFWKSLLHGRWYRAGTIFRPSIRRRRVRSLNYDLTLVDADPGVYRRSFTPLWPNAARLWRHAMNEFESQPG